MSGIKRLTLISDPTDEFPNNANNSFKVRLPERLSLPGEGWHASLMSLTVPDQGQSNAVIAADPHTKVIRYIYPQMTRKWTDTGDPSTSWYFRIEVPKGTGMIELRFPSACPVDPNQWARTMARRRHGMKGGTIFGMGDPRKVLWANQAKARRQRRRKGIKRGRR